MNTIMQKIFVLLFSLSFFLACNHETKKGFEISGTIKNSNEKMVYLQETPLGTGQRFISDSSEIGKDGSYHLNAKASEESLFSLFLKNQQFPFAYVINDAPKITVNADVNSENSYEVKGSPASRSLKDFSINAFNKRNDLYMLGKEMENLKNSNASDSVMISINDKGKILISQLREYVKNFIQNSSDPITSVWALGNNSDIFPENDYQALLNGIVKKFPDHKGIAEIKKLNDRQVALAEQKKQQLPQEPQWIGKPAPELSLPDMNGKQVKLSSFKGKYLLVDFWASWCLPCRQENPNVVEAYNKYKNKNFTILGVSLDEEKGDWLHAVEHDQLSWVQVSDLQSWNSIAVSTYDFKSIPFNVLIDPDGKIIAQSLRGSELDEKLSEILK
ncbi:MAG TPA: TlpA disulfide reductase family protein [Chitinophagaceae bacterium]|jgi:peroxiredoxin|nr:TlpA disulfide reductase family protein [Chitinophagaceae bacterium]